MEKQTVNSDITLQDLITMVSIIDACSTRGAFKGEEMQLVGQVRDKLAAIVKANTPAVVDEQKQEEVIASS
jgi:hypothetical protein